MLALVGIFSFALPGIAQEGTASAGKVYLVPGIYYDAGVSGGKAYNTIDVGAEKLTAEQEAEILSKMYIWRAKQAAFCPNLHRIDRIGLSAAGGTRSTRRSLIPKQCRKQAQKIYFSTPIGETIFASVRTCSTRTRRGNTDAQLYAYHAQRRHGGTNRTVRICARRAQCL